MKKIFYLYAILLSVFAVSFHSCKKETSFEMNRTPAEATLEADANGDCFPSEVEGVYEVAVPLSGADNYIEISLEITAPGLYEIYTDTVNGVSFKGSGIATNAETLTLKLAGSGTPISSGMYNFRVQFAGQMCIVQVPFLPEGAGGPAEFTFAQTGDPAICDNFIVNGLYGEGNSLTPTNTVTLSLNVTTIGTYNISSTTVNGMTFSGKGVFLNTGIQTVVLKGSGTPVAGGEHSFSVTVGSSFCAFKVDVLGQANLAFTCDNGDLVGNYEEGEPLNSSNILTLEVDVITPGFYNISISANGVTFSGSGEVLTTGLTNITLVGSGTPKDDGDFNFVLSPSCTLVITFVPSTKPPSKGTWSFTAQGKNYSGVFYSGTYDLTDFAGSKTLSTSATGEPTSGSGSITIVLGDRTPSSNPVIKANETYQAKSTSLTANYSAFSYAFQDGSNSRFTVDPTVLGNNFVYKLASHNTTTKTISGTFSGNVKDNNGGNVNITNGKFSYSYE